MPLPLVRRIAVRVLPDPVLGVLDFLRPTTRNQFGGPMNGQAERQRMFRELVSAIEFRAVVETGTFRGDTTRFLAKISGTSVYTAESQRRYHTFSSLRFLFNRQIHVCLGDSRAVLGSLARDARFPRSLILFYLDAHWYTDLPLRGELEEIEKHFQDWVIVVDDFHVPDDPGYTFDDYGAKATLDLSILPEALVESTRLFWPAAPSVRETGARRGSIVIASDPAMATRLAKLSSLRPHRSRTHE